MAVPEICSYCRLWARFRVAVETDSFPCVEKAVKAQTVRSRLILSQGATSSLHVKSRQVRATQ